jgi:hypothetical protein
VPKPPEATRRTSSSALPNLDEVEAEAEEDEASENPAVDVKPETSSADEGKGGRSGSGIIPSSPRTDPEDVEANTAEWYVQQLFRFALRLPGCCVRASDVSDSRRAVDGRYIHVAGRSFWETRRRCYVRSS